MRLLTPASVGITVALLVKRSIADCSLTCGAYDNCIDAGGSWVNIGFCLMGQPDITTETIIDCVGFNNLQTCTPRDATNAYLDGNGNGQVCAGPRDLLIQASYACKNCPGITDILDKCPEWQESESFRTCLCGQVDQSAIDCLNVCFGKQVLSTPNYSPWLASCRAPPSIEPSSASPPATICGTTSGGASTTLSTFTPTSLTVTSNQAPQTSPTVPLPRTSRASASPASVNTTSRSPSATIPTSAATGASSPAQTGAADSLGTVRHQAFVVAVIVALVAA